MASKTQYELEILLGARKASSFNGAINKATSDLDSIDKTANRVAGAVTAAFAAINITGAISDAIDTYSEFDQSLASAAATFNATSTELEILESASRDAGKSTSKTAGESADALGYMALAGWDVAESAESLMPMLKTSVATQIDLAETSDLVTDSMSALKLQVSDLPEYLDAVVKGNDSANMTSQQMMQAMTLAGGAANTLKIGYTDLGTAIGVLANNGTKGTKAGTVLNSMFTRMASNENATAQMKKLGISIFDANGEFVGMENALIAINKGLSGLNMEEKAQALKQIAGTQYYSKMVYLLDSVKEGAEGAESAWDELNGNLNNADGALDKKYEKMTDTVSGHTDTMQSAFEDMQISFVDAFSGEYMDILDDFAGVFNDVSDSISDFAEENEIEIHNFVEGAKDGIADAVGILGQGVELVIENFDTIEAAFEGLTVTLAGYKILNGINSLSNALMGFASNPVSLVVAGTGILVAGLVAVNAAIRNAERSAAKSNLDARFGDIALSLEDIDVVAQKIVGAKKLNQVSEMLEAIGDTSDLIESLAGDIKNINKIKWKLDAGFEISEDDKDSYINNVEKYIEDAQGVLDSKGYSVSIATDILLGENSELGSENDAFYAGLDDKMGSLSKKLKKKINKAVKNGVDIDTDDAIQKLLGEMSEITDAITGAENEAALQTIELEYSGKDLSSATFEQLTADIAKYQEKAAEGASEAYQTSMTSLNARLKLGDITQNEFDEKKAELEEGYFRTQAEAYSNGYDFIMNTIKDTYPELETAISNLKTTLDSEIKETMDSGISGEQLYDKLNLIAENAVDNLDIDDDTAGGLMMLFESGLNDIYDGMSRLEEEMNNANVQVPEGISKGLNDADALQAMSGDVEDMLYLMGDQLGNSPAYAAVIKTAEGTGGNLPKGIAEGIQRNSGEMTSAVENMLAAVRSAAGGTIYSGTVKITTSMAEKELEAAPQNIKKNALGGIYNKEILTTVAEDGPEAIIPLNHSSRAQNLLERAAEAMGFSLATEEKGATPEYGSTFSRGSGATRSTKTQRNSGSSSSAPAMQVMYSPQIIIQGAADQEAVVNALEISKERFAKLMKQWENEKQRTSFQGGGGRVQWQS